MSNFENLIEDRIYSISNFGLNANLVTQYTYSRHPLKLSFFLNTKLEEFDELAIPHNSFQFVEFDKINDNSLDGII